MSQHALDYIKRQITEYLRQNPQDANELLSSVALGMTQYKQKVQEERKGQMQNCVGMLYSLIKKKSFSKMELACVLPSLFIAIPRAKITNQGDRHFKILQLFLDGVKSYYGASSDDFYKYKEWVMACHGAEMSEWFEELVDNAKSNGMIKFDW